MWSYLNPDDDSERAYREALRQAAAWARTEAAWNSAQVPDPDDVALLAQPHRITAGPAADPDPELTLYREVTGRPVFSRTHAGWLAEYLVTGLDLPKERMLALVTEHQHDDLLDGYAAEPGPRTVHDDDGHSRPADTRQARAARGEIMAAWTGWPRQALTAWQDLPGSWKGMLLFTVGYVLFIATIAALVITHI